MAEQVNISPATENALAIVDERQLPDLSERESLWLSHYFDCGFDATLAAERAFAYPRHATCMQIGWEIKHRPHVQAQIKARIADLGVTRERIAANLARIANADWSQMVQVKYGGKNSDGTDRIVDARMDLTSTVRANELLGQEVGMFNKKVDHTVEVVQKRIVGVNLDDL